jgi:hypothetical protein
VRAPDDRALGKLGFKWLIGFCCEKIGGGGLAFEMLNPSCPRQVDRAGKLASMENNWHR